MTAIISTLKGELSQFRKAHITCMSSEEAESLKISYTTEIKRLTASITGKLYSFLLLLTLTHSSELQSSLLAAESEKQAVNTKWDSEVRLQQQTIDGMSLYLDLHLWFTMW